VTITIGHDRVPRVFWGTSVPGAEVWLGSETSTSLDPDGCVVRRHDSTATKSTEDTGAFETANESADAMPHTSAKKTQKVCKGGGLPLDKEPSNGCLISCGQLTHELELTTADENATAIFRRVSQRTHKLMAMPFRWKKDRLNEPGTLTRP